MPDFMQRLLVGSEGPAWLQTMSGGRPCAMGREPQANPKDRGVEVHQPAAAGTAIRRRPTGRPRG